MFGIVVSVPTAIVVSSLSGNCPLYAQVTWPNQTLPDIQFKTRTPCDFVTYVSVVTGIGYSLGMVVYSGFGLSKRNRNIGAQMWVMPFILINSAVTILTFIAACVTTVGLAQFCSSMVNGGPFKSCGDGQKLSFDKRPWDMSNYNDFFTTAQAAEWINFFLWLFQFVLTVARLLRNRHLRSKSTYYDEPVPSEEPALLSDDDDLLQP